MTVSGDVKLVQGVAEVLEMACKMEATSAHDYNMWAIECSANADAVSKKIFEQLVAEEEVHYAQYENELDNVKQFGDRYLVLQSIERAKSQGAAAGPAE